MALSRAQTLENQRIYQRSYRKQQKEREAKDRLSTEEDDVECICPRCGRKHTLKFNWTGRGIPRKFCIPLCKKASHRLSEYQPGNVLLTSRLV